MNKTIAAFLCLLIIAVLSGTIAEAQNPVVTTRFANPEFNCVSGTYTLDVEFQSNTPGRQLADMNVRFFYDDAVLDFVSINGLEGGYQLQGQTEKAPGTPGSGSKMFGFLGNAVFVNGTVTLANLAAPSIDISTNGWTKLFSVSFTVSAGFTGSDSFCPPIVWDLEADPANGSFLNGSDGLVITLMDVPVSVPADEQVVQFNWQYSGTATLPYGAPVQMVCCSSKC